MRRPPYCYTVFLQISLSVSCTVPKQTGHRADKTGRKALWDEDELPQQFREHPLRRQETLLISQGKENQHRDSILTPEVSWTHGHT